GERGIYKSIDGGKTWKRVLGDTEWIGATDIIVDPRNEDIMYAATWQRHRTIAAYMGGGPGSGIHKSTDGGETWTKLSSGLPTSNMGKIGLAISPQKPDVLYAAIELDRRKGAVYRSENKGISWNKMSDEVAGGTGPHYYQELWVSPHQFDKLYLANNVMKISTDGGKTFESMNVKNIHVDNHAVAFKKNHPNYIMIGCDGGLYESYDNTKTWRFFSNLPITQYYKLAVDDALPFYNIFGGTQDNNSHAGPSETDNSHGIRNADWQITFFGDGHQPATEPGNPNIIYNQLQQGVLARVDRATGEYVLIKPQPKEGEPFERFNWDAPILVSPHDPKRIYCASYRLWRSDNRGDQWKPISKDLTKDQNRIELPIMGRKQSYDNPWDFYAMSTFNTITSISESPVQKDLLYIGTDDGSIWCSENGGDEWRQIELSSIPGAPKNAYVNDIKTDQFDPNTVYVVLDNHKNGDFKPYLFKSTNKGKSWQSISQGIPDRTILWRIVQDHVSKDLLFLASEFGIYCSVDGGSHWVQLKGNVPTISFRDLVIQKRENDLVCASFGRGFFILDDYSFLRKISAETVEKKAHLIHAEDAHWYIQRQVMGWGEKGAQGDGYYVAPNAPYGATFTYYLRESIKTDKKKRQESEKKEKGDVPFVGWESLDLEFNEEEPKIMFVIKNESGKVVRRLFAKAQKGFHKITWDMRFPASNMIKLNPNPLGNNDWTPKGIMAPPGKYSVSMYQKANGNTIKLSEPLSFELKKLHQGSLKGMEVTESASYWEKMDDFSKNLSLLYADLSLSKKKVKALRKALDLSLTDAGNLDVEIRKLQEELFELDRKIHGNKSKRDAGEKTDYVLSERTWITLWGSAGSTYGPTEDHLMSFELVKKQFSTYRNELDQILNNKIPNIEEKLIKNRSPYIEGR
ncbi:MAG: glycosyl hydrolase, partial [Flavobacteriales bacterium]|nr:glycosyl hydrolase [Flavobacteriales bacterium]